MKNDVRTLYDMNKFFESRGIKVTRDYESSKKRYHFMLSRGNCIKVYFFYYPTTHDLEEKYAVMTSACQSMLEDFDKFCDENPPKEPDKSRYLQVINEPKEFYFPWDPKAVKKVIFNDPATIVFWSDGSKTVVKCSENDIYDPEKGLAMAFAKKMFGNDNSFHKLFTKWLPKEEANTSADIKAEEFAAKLGESLRTSLTDFYKQFDKNFAIR